MREVNIYGDGACSGNPGPGGWGAILEWNGNIKKISGGEVNTTNNRMEITAIIEALSLLKEPCEVIVTTDSRYVTDTFNKGWIDRWRANNWLKSDNKPALNRDLWEKLLNVMDGHKVTFNWIRGHTGHPENEECDAMAVAYYKTHMI